MTITAPETPSNFQNALPQPSFAKQRQLLLGGSLLCVALTWAVAIWLATHQPWLGLSLSSADPTQSSTTETKPSSSADKTPTGLLIESASASGPAKDLKTPVRLMSISHQGGISLNLKASDLIEEPDVFSTYQEWNAFYIRQQQLHEALKHGSVELTLQTMQGQASKLTLSPASNRPVSSLPVVFWFQLFVGAFAMLVGAWVLSARLDDLSARCLAITGLGLLMSASCAAIYSSRELALDRALFHILSGGNHTGATIFGIGLVGIFMFHPQRLFSTRLFIAGGIVFLIWNLADVMWWLPFTDLGNRLTILTQMLLAIALGIWQWRRSRGMPVDRAALRWVLLSFLLGSGGFVVLIVCTVMLGWIQPISQGYAFGLFLTMYIGLALGVRRYRLFDLDVWSLRTLMWLFGVLGIVALDAALISLLNWNNTASLAASMLVCAALYFPIRQWLWSHLFGRKERNLEDLTADMVSLALIPEEQRLLRWQGILVQLFAPNRFETLIDLPPSQHNAVSLMDEGLGLHIPAIAGLPAMHMWERDKGKRLFSSSDKRLAQRLHDLIRIVLQTRDAYHRGAAEERMRIAGDLHDDLGARLLSMVHSSKDQPHLASTARMALDDMRMSVRGLTAQPALANLALADWRGEIMQRLQAAGLNAHWQANEPPPDLLLGARLQVQFTRILREAVSNVIRHAQAQQCRVTLVVSETEIVLKVEDDGRGLPQRLSEHQAGDRGHGLINIERRAHNLGGSHHFGDSDLGGALVIVRLPLSTDSQPMPFS